MVEKQVEVAHAAQVQAELGAEKARDDADHATEHSETQIAAVRDSTAQAVELAQRQTKAARQRSSQLAQQAEGDAAKIDGMVTASAQAVASQREAQADKEVANGAYETARNEKQLAETQQSQQVVSLGKRREEMEAGLTEALSSDSAARQDLREAKEGESAVRLKETEANMHQSDSMMKFEFQTEVAQTKAAAEEKDAKNKAHALEEEAQMQLDADEQKYAVKLSSVRSAENARAGEASERAAVETRAQESASEIEIQGQEARREAALHRLSQAQTSLEHAREDRIKAVAQRQQFELKAKQHHADVIKIRQQIKRDELNSKSEEREADKKHKEKVARMELDQKAIEKARADELSAKEVFAKSTSAPTATPTKAPTASPTIAPSNAPTAAPTVPRPCINVSGYIIRNVSAISNVSGVSNVSAVTSDVLAHDMNVTSGLDHELEPQEDHDELKQLMNTTDSINQTDVASQQHTIDSNVTMPAGTADAVQNTTMRTNSESETDNTAVVSPEEELPEIAPQTKEVEQLNNTDTIEANTTAESTTNVSNPVEIAPQTEEVEQLNNTDTIEANTTAESTTNVSSPATTNTTEEGTHSNEALAHAQVAKQYLDQVQSRYASASTLGDAYGVNGVEISDIG
jgi:hypothetical protein